MTASDMLEVTLWNRVTKKIREMIEESANSGFGYIIVPIISDVDRECLIKLGYRVYSYNGTININWEWL